MAAVVCSGSNWKPSVSSIPTDFNFRAHSLVDVFSQALGGLHTESVREVALGVFAFRLQLVRASGRLLAHRDDLQHGSVPHAGFEWREVIGQTKTLASRLAREGH